MHCLEPQPLFLPRRTALSSDFIHLNYLPPEITDQTDGLDFNHESILTNIKLGNGILFYLLRWLARENYSFRRGIRIRPKASAKSNRGAQKNLRFVRGVGRTRYSASPAGVNV